ncbi:uncharacterized protein FOKN1_0833 [Thiohalobacter thiocyanaticus]|uniref:Water stress and hypersensitive response domain-containing protein n=1 Tax=Thiohalobacter thiocyanaticus TaxID=585455 RepID=A0A1Z4VP10_9GAMM|nr:LEA type 2 family protein [Thiohalobacter thiocyanaticus]BAZ93235.1 uncharacterized protein FOKN1_0833 [Thiohalobacter thiocyanaticus]
MPRCRSHRCSLPALALLLLLAGCSHFLTRPEAPSVSLNNLQLVEATLFEQRYLLHLRIQNPNNFDLPISGMSYRLLLNGREFATGVSRDLETLPAYGEQVITVSVVSNLLRIYEQLRSPGDGEAFSYALEGSISLQGLRAPLPFSQRGELALNPR